MRLMIAGIAAVLMGMAGASTRMLIAGIAAVLMGAAGASTVHADEYGTVLGTVNSITVYSNGQVGYVSGVTSSVNGYTCGIKWQCVEFCSRYYWVVYGKKIAGGNANSWYANPAAKGLTANPNGGASIPKVGDILCSESGPGGHVAIIRAVNVAAKAGTFDVIVAHQNWTNTSADLAKTFTMTLKDGKYTIAASGAYAWQGWLRR